MSNHSRIACLIALLCLNSADVLAHSHKHRTHNLSHKTHETHRSHGTKLAHSSNRQTLKRHPFVVAIDAGHGGKDTGAIGPSGVYEKQVAYAISRKLQQLIDKDETMQPVMVRNGDRFIGLQERGVIARKAGADLFVSVHADAFRDDDAKGSSVYTLLNRKGRSGPTASTRKASNRAAAKILSELRSQQPLHCRHVKRAGYAVLKTPGIPSMLIETGFITNPIEEKKLASKAHQEKLAHSIYNGIRAYARTARPRVVKHAKPRHVMLASK